MTVIVNDRVNGIQHKAYVGFFISDMRKYAELSMQFHGTSQVMDLILTDSNGFIIADRAERLSVLNILEWCMYNARQNGFDGIPVHKSFMVDCFTD